MIEVDDLRFSYGPVEALRGVSFSIRPGEICGYLGPNGAGKSTTVKSLVGIQQPASGSVRIFGQDIAASPLAVKRRIGYVPENAAAFSLLTAREYLELVGELYCVRSDVCAANIASLIANLGLAAFADRWIATLSKGQRQKVVLAAALVHDPDVLILDEPLTGLDANAARMVKDLLLGLAGRGRVILFCSHVLEVVEHICARVIVINRGQVVADGKTPELLELSRTRSLEELFRQLTLDEGQDHTRALLDGLRPTVGGTSSAQG